jgi:hypothetical protein
MDLLWHTISEDSIVAYPHALGKNIMVERVYREGNSSPHGRQEAEVGGDCGPGIIFKGTTSVTYFLNLTPSPKISSISQNSATSWRPSVQHKPMGDISYSNHNIIHVQPESRTYRKGVWLGHVEGGTWRYA